MLRKRTRSHQKDQQNMGQGHNPMPDSSSNEFYYSNSDAFLKQKHKHTSLFTVPGLFVGLNPKNSESDSVRSPTSPLDFKVFSKQNLKKSPFTAPKQPQSTQKSWDCNKVGLSIIESLENDTKVSVLRASDSKTILYAPQMRILKNPGLKNACFDPFDSISNSLPKNYAIFPYTQIKKSNPQMINPLAQESFVKTWSHSFDSANSGSNLTRLTTRPTKLSSNPEKDIVASLSASEIELSEDYTCVRKHGPNPKTTHIFGDCILERHNDEFIAKPSKHEEDENSFSEIRPSYVLSDNFLSFCYSCKKKLEGEDIYMYRGEKAFCSWNCRSQEILIEEAKEKTNGNEPNNCEEVFETSMFIAT